MARCTARKQRALSGGRGTLRVACRVLCASSIACCVLHSACGRHRKTQSVQTKAAGRAAQFRTLNQSIKAQV
jgi:hypothetical protein